MSHYARSADSVVAHAMRDEQWNQRPEPRAFTSDELAAIDRADRVMKSYRRVDQYIVRALRRIVRWWGSWHVRIERDWSAYR